LQVGTAALFYNMKKHKPQNPKNFPKIDAFPNCEGLSEFMGLTQPDDLPPATMTQDGKSYAWISICSKHRISKPECNLCKTGSYHEVDKDGHLV